MSKQLKSLKNEILAFIIDHIGRIEAQAVSKIKDVVMKGRNVEKLRNIKEALENAIKDKKKKINYKSLNVKKVEIKAPQPKPVVDTKSESTISLVFYGEYENTLDMIDVSTLQDGDIVFIGERKRKQKIYYRDGKLLYALKAPFITNAPNYKLSKYQVKKFYYQKDMKTLVFMLGKYDNDLLTLYDNIKSQARAVEITEKEKIENGKGTNLLEVDYKEGQPKLFNEYISIEANKEAKEFKDLFVDKFSVDYLNQNYKKNACLYTAIIEEFKTQFDQIYKKNKLTYEYLYQMIHEKDYQEGEDLSLKLKSVVPFFQKYRLIFKAYDIQNNLIFQYHPEQDQKEINKMFNKCSLYIVCHDNHVFRLNADLKRLSHLSNDDEVEITVDGNFFVMDKQNYSFFINNVEEIIKIDFDAIESKYMTVVYGGDMRQLYHDLIVKYSYKPRVAIRAGGVISKLVIGVGEKVLFFVPPCSSSVEPDLKIIDKETFNAYNELDFKLYNSIVNYDNLSRYDPDFFYNLKALMPVALCNKLNDVIVKESKIGCIDICKAYTHYLRSLDKLPVSGNFDNFEIYKGEPLEDNHMYVCERVSLDFNPKYSIILPQKLNLLSGMTLKAMFSEIERFINVRYVISFSKFQQNKTSSIIKEIYQNNQLSPYEKKFIVNKITGILEKSKNNKYKSWCFETLNEARVFKETYGGGIYCLNLTNQETNEEIRERNELDKGIVDEEPTPYNVQDPKKIYYVLKNNEKLLDNGFLPIKALIYDALRFNMQKLYNLYSEKYNILAIKTDALYVEIDKDEEAEFNELVNKTQKEKKADPYKYIGKVAYSWSDIDFVPSNPIFVKPDVELKIRDEVRINNIEIKNEYDQDEFKKVFDKQSKILIEAVIPGAGKTYAIEQYIKNNKLKAIFVLPYNLQAYELIKKNYEAMTLYGLTGTILKDNFKEAHINTNIDFDSYDVIVFDEIYCYKTTDLFKIKKFMLEHPKLKYFATGDTNQNKPINDTNIKNYKEYYQKIVYSLFENVMTLKICKRFKTIEDQRKVMAVKYDIFNTDMSIEEICKKHFKIINNYEDIKGFCVTYFNKTADHVNRYLHDKTKPTGVNINGMMIHEKLQLRARSYIKLGKQKINTNFTYTIKKVDAKNKKIHLIDLLDKNNILIIDFKMLTKFTLPYSGTCHSVQGLTVDKEITIFDVNSFGATREWFYTAITRATYFDNIQIFIQKKQNMNEIKAKIQNKINGHLIYDKLKKHSIQDYVDVAWVLKSIENNGAKCAHCQDVMEIDYEPNSEKQFSINRIDNKKGHVKNNCNIVCLKCNVSNH